MLPRLVGPAASAPATLPVSQLLLDGFHRLAGSTLSVLNALSEDRPSWVCTTTVGYLGHDNADAASLAICHKQHLVVTGVSPLTAG